MLKFLFFLEGGPTTLDGFLCWTNLKYIGTALIFMGYWETVQNQIRDGIILCLIKIFTVYSQNVLLKFGNEKFHQRPLYLEWAHPTDKVGMFI